MSVLAIFTYEVKPGRMADFMAKLTRAGGPEFQSPIMPKSVRVFRNTVPGPETEGLTLIIEYDDMVAYGARTSYEAGNAAWQALFAAGPDSPERLRGVQLLTEAG